MSDLQLDRAGRRRSPATMPGFLAGRPPRNKGLRYPADPPKVEEIIAVMRAAGDGAHGRRLRGLIVILWRAGLRIHEALALTEADLDQRRGSLSSAAARADAAAKSAWTTGAGKNSSPGSNSASRFPSGRCSVSSTERRAADGATAARPRAAPTRRSRSRRAPALRAAPASPRPRRGDGTRRRAPDRHPTPTRPQQARHHLHLPPRHRQRRDHRHRPRPTRTHGSRQRIATTLRTPAFRARQQSRAGSGATIS